MRKRTELYLMRYGITNILRSLPKSIALVCAAMVLTLSICIISQSIVTQTQSLEDVYSEYIIETVITDQFCIEETNLAMNSRTEKANSIASFDL
jgi:predicted PurR-regulated permease PerM